MDKKNEMICNVLKTIGDSRGIDTETMVDCYKQTHDLDYLIEKVSELEGKSDWNKYILMEGIAGDLNNPT